MRSLAIGFNQKFQFLFGVNGSTTILVTGRNDSVTMHVMLPFGTWLPPPKPPKNRLSTRSQWHVQEIPWTGTLVRRWPNCAKNWQSLGSPSFEGWTSNFVSSHPGYAAKNVTCRKDACQKTVCYVSQEKPFPSQKLKERHVGLEEKSLPGY